MFYVKYIKQENDTHKVTLIDCEKKTYSTYQPAGFVTKIHGSKWHVTDLEGNDLGYTKTRTGAADLLWEKMHEVVEVATEDEVVVDTEDVAELIEECDRSFRSVQHDVTNLRKRIKKGQGPRVHLLIETDFDRATQELEIVRFNCEEIIERLTAARKIASGRSLVQVEEFIKKYQRLTK